MKKFLTVAVVAVLALAAGSVAYANICAYDPVPASTLLFPFVAYNYEEGADGVNTLFAITNVSSEAQIVHVTLWTDYSIPVLDWNVLLTGYDVYTFDIRAILKDGVIVPTFTVEYDADGDGDNEGVLDQGPVSNANPLVDPNWDGPMDVLGNDTGMGWPEDTWKFYGDGEYPCGPENEAYPGRFDGFQIDEGILGFFQSMLQASQMVNDGFQNCDLTAPYHLQQSNWWDDRDASSDTWGYITADVVNACNKAFPDEEIYWDNFAEVRNVLIGDVIWLDQANNYSEVENAVHIEASYYLDQVATPGPNEYPTSFYGRYANGYGLEDFREPLPTAWAFRYITGTLGDGSELNTMIRAFKANTNSDYTIVPDLYAELDVLNSQATSLVALNCLAYTYYVWDEEENIDVVPVENPPYSGGPEEQHGVVPNFLPLETQEVSADHFNLVDNAGWLLFVWPFSNLATNPLDFDQELAYQTWMGVKYVTNRPGGGGYSGAKDGAVLANANCFEEQILDWGLGIDYQYVDEGGYVRWTGSSE